VEDRAVAVKAVDEAEWAEEWAAARLAEWAAAEWVAAVVDLRAVWGRNSRSGPRSSFRPAPRPYRA